MADNSNMHKKGFSGISDLASDIQELRRARWRERSHTRWRASWRAHLIANAKNKQKMILNIPAVIVCMVWILTLPTVIAGLIINKITEPPLTHYLALAFFLFTCLIGTIFTYKKFAKKTPPRMAWIFGILTFLAGMIWLFSILTFLAGMRWILDIPARLVSIIGSELSKNPIKYLAGCSAIFIIGIFLIDHIGGKESSKRKESASHIPAKRRKKASHIPE